MKKTSPVNCRMRSIVLLAFVVSVAGGAPAGPWPRFRGPDGAGISDATTVPATWTEADYNWKVSLPGQGHSSPVVWGGRIFLTCGDRATAKRMLLCLRAADGRVLWRREYASSTFRQHRDNSYASATPAADAEGGVITWATPKAVVLLALDPAGREVWRRGLGPVVHVDPSAHAVAAQRPAEPAHGRDGIPRRAGRTARRILHLPFGHVVQAEQ